MRFLGGKTAWLTITCLFAIGLAGCGSQATTSSQPVSPSPTQLGLTAFAPSLDVAEPMITTGSSAMHEELGSAFDGVVFLKDYAYSKGGGDNVYTVTLYRSFDGVEWKSVTVPTPSNQQDSRVACRGWNCIVMSDFPQNGDGLVTDDGRHWDRIDPSPNLFQVSVTAGRDGFILTGYEQTAKPKPRVLFSEDGRVWRDIAFEAGSTPVVTGAVFSDPSAGWLLIGGTQPNSGGDAVVIALSADGRTWRQVVDPDHVFSTDHSTTQAVFHFDGRWYVMKKYRQMPDGYSPGGLGRPASTSTPVASWQTIYSIEDGSNELRSSGRLAARMPDEVVVMDGYLVGATANEDYTGSLLLSTDVTHWTDQGLLPPGVPSPSSIHGMTYYDLPELCRAGKNVLMAGPALKADEMGGGLYVAKPLE